MGDVTVPGVTEDELRAAAMDAAAAKAQRMGRKRFRDLGPGEFTLRDWMERDREEWENVAGASRDPKYQTVARELADMMRAGIVERSREKRRDPRVGKAVWAYRYVNGE